MVNNNNKTVKKSNGGSIYGKTRIDKEGDVILAVSPKNKLSNSVDVFEKRNEELKRIYQSNSMNRLPDFYRVANNKKNVVLTNDNLLHSGFIRGKTMYFKSIVYMDENDKVLFPKDFARVLSSSKKKVFETEICFTFLNFNQSFGILKNRSYTMNIICTKELREIKIDRGFVYHGIYLDSTMSYNSWKYYNEPKTPIDIDYTYDTFWFNLFPLLQQHMAIIFIEAHLINKQNEHDDVNKKIKEFVDVIIKPDPKTDHEKKEE